MQGKPQTHAEKNRDQAKKAGQVHISKKEEKLMKMSDEDVKNALKDKALAIYGTRAERFDRLKKAYGIPINPVAQTSKEVINVNYVENPKDDGKPKKKKDAALENIEKIQAKREERRVKQEKLKDDKQNKEIENKANGILTDVDFELMINQARYTQHLFQPHTNSSNIKLSVNVRKRPIFAKDQQKGEIDSVSCANPNICVHEPKFKVDGISKFIQNHQFTFDNTYNENEDSKTVFDHSVGRPLIEKLFKQSAVTLFAYGQTGSGKTFTMKSIQNHAVEELFNCSNSSSNKHLGVKFYMSFYEIYGAKCWDLLNKNNKVQVLEDKNNQVQIHGLTEHEVGTADEMQKVIEFGHTARTTHCTAANDTSSRSHAICQIHIKDKSEKFVGKLIVVDLAGSERAQDTQSNNRQRRLEGAEINKSLLALKECIRAMYTGQSHIPFRASKLTLALRDSFIAKKIESYILMIACVCPGSSSADHTQNTLRYADRLKAKEIKEIDQKQQFLLPQVQVNSNRQSMEALSDRDDKEGKGKSGHDMKEDDDRQMPYPPIHQANLLAENKEKVGKENRWQNRNSENGITGMPPIRPQKVDKEQNNGAPAKDMGNYGSKGEINVKRENQIKSSDKFQVIRDKMKDKAESDKRLQKKGTKDEGVEIFMPANPKDNRPSRKDDNEDLSKMRNFYTGDASNQEDPLINDKKQKKFGQLGVPDIQKSEEEDDEDDNEQKKNMKADMEYMRSTMKIDNDNRDVRLKSDEYFDFQEKVNDILEMHDEVLALHMNILKVFYS